MYSSNQADKSKICCNRSTCPKRNELIKKNSSIEDAGENANKLTYKDKDTQMSQSTISTASECSAKSTKMYQESSQAYLNRDHQNINSCQCHNLYPPNSSKTSQTQSEMCAEMLRDTSSNHEPICCINNIIQPISSNTEWISKRKCSCKKLDITSSASTSHISMHFPVVSKSHKCRAINQTENKMPLPTVAQVKTQLVNPIYVTAPVSLASASLGTHILLLVSEAGKSEQNYCGNQSDADTRQQYYSGNQSFSPLRETPKLSGNAYTSQQLCNYNLTSTASKTGPLQMSYTKSRNTSTSQQLPHLNSTPPESAALKIPSKPICHNCNLSSSTSRHAPCQMSGSKSDQYLSCNSDDSEIDEKFELNRLKKPIKRHKANKNRHILELLHKVVNLINKDSPTREEAFRLTEGISSTSDMKSSKVTQQESEQNDWPPSCICYKYGVATALNQPFNFPLTEPCTMVTSPEVQTPQPFDYTESKDNLITNTVTPKDYYYVCAKSDNDLKPYDHESSEEDVDEELKPIESAERKCKKSVPDPDEEWIKNLKRDNLDDDEEPYFEGKPNILVGKVDEELQLMLKQSEPYQDEEWLKNLKQDQSDDKPKTINDDKVIVAEINTDEKLNRDEPNFINEDKIIVSKAFADEERNFTTSPVNPQEKPEIPPNDNKILPIIKDEFSPFIVEMEPAPQVKIEVIEKEKISPYIVATDPITGRNTYNFLPELNMPEQKLNRDDESQNINADKFIVPKIFTDEERNLTSSPVVPQENMEIPTDGNKISPIIKEEIPFIKEMEPPQVNKEVIEKEQISPYIVATDPITGRNTYNFLPELNMPEPTKVIEQTEMLPYVVATHPTTKEEESDLYDQEEAEEVELGKELRAERHKIKKQDYDLKEIEGSGSPEEMKFFIDSLILDLNAMDFARRKSQFENNISVPGGICSRQGFPVTITDVTDLGATSLYVKWKIHDCYGVAGYEIYTDGYLTNRYYNNRHESAVITQIDVTIPHKIALMAQPSSHDDCIEAMCHPSKNKPKSLPWKNDEIKLNKITAALWTPSIFLYDPCTCKGNVGKICQRWS